MEFIYKTYKKCLSNLLGIVVRNRYLVGVEGRVEHLQTKKPETQCRDFRGVVNSEDHFLDTLQILALPNVAVVSFTTHRLKFSVQKIKHTEICN